MLNNITTLVKYNIKSQFSFKNIKNYIKNNKGMFLTFVILGVFIVSYIFGQAIVLIELGLGDYIPILIFFLIFIISFIATFSKARDQIYSFRNKDIFMTFPLKTLWIVQSRFIIIYFYNLLINLLITIPFAIVYFIFVKVSSLTIVSWVLLTLFIPVISISLALILSSVFSRLLSEFKNNNYLYNGLALLLTIIVIFLSTYLPFKYMDVEFSIAGVTLFVREFLNSIMYYIVPLNWIFNIFKNNSIFYLFIVIASSVIIYLITVVYINSIFLKININKGKKKNSGEDIETKAFSKKSILKALYIKELKSYFNSRIYALNTIIGPILLIVISGTILLFGFESIGSLVGNIDLTMIGNIYPYIACMMISMSCTTHVSLSYEGKNIWFIKSSPIDNKNLYNSKILLNLTIIIPAVLVYILSVIKSGFKIEQILIAIFIVLSFMVFIAILGLKINLKFLNFNWENEVKLVKQSINTFIIVLIGIVGTMLIIGINIIFKNFALYINTIIIFLLVISSLVLYKNIIKLSF
ncbi:hypothetical protein [Miniphocaeibacter halophilus]|uniref:Uncharacterized protein n=1 Tax=Miniphocaeibacter halophilus TaxID=2931922 RepID=A0AC61N6J0_9FIRM|nr:hypothetical protein [Miniphocaeibacter halophilus]QQK08123.1 hypothetical protein JFY71_00885 [Miniphocaeibacter halophilus]